MHCMQLSAKSQMDYYTVKNKKNCWSNCNLKIAISASPFSSILHALNSWIHNGWWKICWEFLRVQTCGLAASSRILSIFSIIGCGFTTDDGKYAENSWDSKTTGLHPSWKGVTNYNWSFMLCSLINFCLKPWSYTHHITCSLPAFSRIFIKFWANSSGSIVFKLFDTLCPRLLYWAAAHSSRTKNDRIRHASADHPARRF